MQADRLPAEDERECLFCPAKDSQKKGQTMQSNGSTALARIEPAPLAPMTFTSEQRQLIRDMYARGASDLEFAALMEVAVARRLNPLLKQIYFVKRWDKALGREVWAAQVSIDGLRAVAQRTGLYDGQDEPEFVGESVKLECCKVRVYRKDWTRPAVGVAYWAEYVQRGKSGELTPFWARMPHVMLSKCAEAIALRKAFPEDTAGLYVPEEMGQADNPEPLPARAAPRELMAERVERIQEVQARLAQPAAMVTTEGTAVFVNEQAPPPHAPPSSGDLPQQNDRPSGKLPDDAADILLAQATEMIDAITAANTREAVKAFADQAKTGLPEPFRTPVLERARARYRELKAAT